MIMLLLQAGRLHKRQEGRATASLCRAKLQHPGYQRSQARFLVRPALMEQGVKGRA